jgi:rRNA-processing protein FCF1
MLFQKSPRVFLDTNFLLIPGTMRVDIFSGIESALPKKAVMFIVKKTVDELDHIVKNPHAKLSDRNAAKLALVLIKQKSLKMVGSSAKGSVDEIILEKAGRDEFVATQDKELKKRLREKGVGVLVLREKKCVMLER